MQIKQYCDVSIDLDELFREVTPENISDNVILPDEELAKKAMLYYSDNSPDGDDLFHAVDLEYQKLLSEIIKEIKRIICTRD